MNKKDLNELKIEQIEKEVLFNIGWLFKNSLESFSTAVDRSLGYLDKIILPIIMASKEEKSYNPFSEIIEKYAVRILSTKLEKEGYRLLPLGYSADLTMEGESYILNIDIKTANLDNPSDFRKNINIGINQTTHVARIPKNKKGEFLEFPFLIYPTIPPYYSLPNGKIKLILTYGLLFIYPPYKDLMEEVNKEYFKLFDFFKKEIESCLLIELKKSEKDRDAEKLLNRKPKNSNFTRKELIIENIIRGIFIHEHESEKILEYLKINGNKLSIIEDFSKKTKEFAEKLRKRDVKPIAIIAIAIPNGLLKDRYIDEFVSGKTYAKSSRYHYKDGVFKVIGGKEIPRVVFLDVNEKYLDELKKYFGKIRVLDYVIKEL